MYNNSNINPTLAVLGIVVSAIGLVASLIRLCLKSAEADDERQSSNLARAIPVQQRPRSTLPVSRPRPDQPITPPLPAAPPLSYPQSTAITIDLVPAPAYEPHPTYPPMPGSSLSSSSLAYPPLAATSLSPAVACFPQTQPQLPSYPQMTQTASNTTDSTPPAYTASATS